MNQTSGISDPLHDPDAASELAALRALAEERLRRIHELEALLAPKSNGPPPSPPAATPRRELHWRAYGLVRPVLRPVAWRLRTFLVGLVRDDVAELRAQVLALRASVDALRAQVEQRAVEDREAVAPKILAVMEQALLTIALDREDRQR
jgi:hypothetical protein